MILFQAYTLISKLVSALPSWSLKQRSLIISSIFLTTLTSGYFLYFSDAIQQWQQQQKQLSKLQKQINVARTHLTQLQQLNLVKASETNELSNESLEIINNIIKDSELNIQQIQPTSIGLLLSLQGTYLQLNKFFQLIIKQLSVTVSQLVINKHLNEININLVLKTAAIIHINHRFKSPINPHIARDPFIPLLQNQNNHSPLRLLALKNLRMVGAIKQDQMIWGIIATPDKHIYMVQTNDIISMNAAKIILITPHMMQLIAAGKIIELTTKQSANY